ncbi:MAG: hypothetical protein ACTHJ3_15310 [Pararhizobium sp.]
MRPVVFNGAVGWLHGADGGRGVVIAGSHGFEDLCSRRFLTLLAERTAQAGLPALQFDYPGCGDAAGDHEDAGVAGWIASIGAAIDALKRETGVRDALVVGFRLGALLAAHAVLGREDVAGIALLAPPTSGRSFVREQVGLARMIDAALPRAEGAAPFDGLETAGFRLSRRVVDDLTRLDWPNICVTRRILLMSKSETPAEAALAQRLVDNGTECVRMPFAGYNRLMCDPTANAVPGDVIESCVSFLSSAAGFDRPGLPAPEGDRTLRHADYEEEPVVIGPAPHLVGVLCRPAADRRSDVATVFLNSGGVPHVGWARGTVEMARALAAAGQTSLRVDLPGLGQSEAPAERQVFLYDRRTRFDVMRAIDWLERRGFRRVGLAGVCAGAFQSLHTARADRRVVRLTMINPLCFRWNASYALDLAVWKTYESSKVTLGQSRADLEERPAAGDGRRLRMGLKWLTRRLRRGIEGVKTAFLSVSVSRLLFGSVVERWIRALSARGVRMTFVSSAGDLSNEEIARHFGPGGIRLAAIPGVTRLVIENADHTLTPRPAREELTRHLIALDLAAAEPDRAVSGETLSVSAADPASAIA